MKPDAPVTNIFTIVYYFDFYDLLMMMQKYSLFSEHSKFFLFFLCVIPT